MHLRSAPQLRDVMLAAVLACGCSSNVQDLGRAAEPEPPPAEEASTGLEGSRELRPSPSDLACPLTRPIEGDDCGAENGAPCTYVGAPEASPDQVATPVDTTTTFCICTAERRWSCLEAVTMKMLTTPLHSGDPCESGLIVMQGGVECRCINGVARCT